MANSPASYWMKKDKCHRAWWKNKDKVRGHVTQTCPLLSTWRAALRAFSCDSSFLLGVDKMMIYGSCRGDGWVSLQAISNSLLLTVKWKFFLCLIRPSQLVCGATVTIICKNRFGNCLFLIKGPARPHWNWWVLPLTSRRKDETFLSPAHSDVSLQH